MKTWQEDILVERICTGKNYGDWKSPLRVLDPAYNRAEEIDREILDDMGRAKNERDNSSADIKGAEEKRKSHTPGK